MKAGIYKKIKKPECFENKKKSFVEVYCQGVLYATRYAFNDSKPNELIHFEYGTVCNFIYVVAYTND